MSTAQEILDSARQKFLNTIDVHDFGCTSNCTGKCSTVNSGSGISSDNKTYHYDNIIEPSFALYCASYDENTQYSNDTAYTCPGHRDFEYINRYPQPTSLQSNTIIYANQLTQLYQNIKTEIIERLKHVFYSNLEF